MTLTKYAIAVILWAVFYLVCAFAVAIGFGAGWKLMKPNQPLTPLALPRLKIKSEATGNGNQPAGTAGGAPAAAPAHHS